MSILKLAALLLGLALFGVLMGYTAYSTEYFTVRMVSTLTMGGTVWAITITVIDLFNYNEEN